MSSYTRLSDAYCCPGAERIAWPHVWPAVTYGGADARLRAEPMITSSVDPRTEASPSTNRAPSDEKLAVHPKIDFLLFDL